MKTSELLKQAKALIENKEHWCQGAHGRDANGYSVTAFSPTAITYCAAGCVDKLDEFENSCARELLEKIAQSNFKGRRIYEVNDELGHDAVMEMYDAAIEEAESREHEK